MTSVDKVFIFVSIGIALAAVGLVTGLDSTQTTENVKRPETTIQQQAFDPKLMKEPLKVKPGTMPSREALLAKLPEQPVPQGEQFIAGGGSDLKAMLAPFKANLGKLREMVANAPDRDNYISDADFQKATDDFDNELDSKFSQIISDLDKMTIDTNALVQLVLREAYMENIETLRDYADKVKFFNEMKKDLRDKLTKARNVASDYQQYDTTSGEEIYPDEYGRVKLQFPWYSSEGLKSLEDENESTIAEFLTLQKRYKSAEIDALDYSNQLQENLDAKESLRETISELRDAILADRWPLKFSYYDENGNAVTVVLSSVKDAMVLEQKLEQSLQTMSDMTQMMQLNLQDAMNKQAQAMQTLTNIMKLQHDTLKAVIRNMKG